MSRPGAAGRGALRIVFLSLNVFFVSRDKKKTAHMTSSSFKMQDWCTPLPHFLSGGGPPNPPENTIFGIPELELAGPKKKNRLIRAFPSDIQKNQVFGPIFLQLFTWFSSKTSIFIKRLHFIEKPSTFIKKSQK